MQSMPEAKEGGGGRPPAFADENGSDSILGVKRGAEAITGDALEQPTSKKQSSKKV